MRGLALAASQNGYAISGLDAAAVPPGTDWLDEHGINWYRLFEPGQLDNVDTVIVSGGTSVDHPALVLARHRDVPVISFAQFLGELTSGRHVISVAGTHGKTTTTSLITWLIDAAGQAPDFLIGIRPFNFESSARLGGSGTFVVEGDEYKASTLEDKSKVEYYHPDTLVLTSVEHDHPDVFATPEAMRARFTRIVAAVPATGLVIANADDEDVLKVAQSARAKVLTYGLESGDYLAQNVAFLPEGIAFDILTSQGTIGRIALPMYGRHNVANALAAVAVATHENIDFAAICLAATTFKGAYRRFNVLTAPDAQVTVIDDYAHHPTEVATTIEAVKLHFAGRRLIVIFRPHTFSRTKALLAEYRQVFSQIEHAYITDIEGARETGNNPDVAATDITRDQPVSVKHVSDRDQLINLVLDDASTGDVVLCMTVSGYDDIAGVLAAKINALLQSR